MAARRENRLRSFLRDAIDNLIDRVLGPEDRLAPGDRCVVRRSIIATNKGVLLKGSTVEVTDVRAPNGHIQVRVVNLPDHDWDAISRLPYGPGFIIYVDPDCLERE